jgi:acetyl-CoA carboxylase biotin carboxylase subunit
LPFEQKSFVPRGWAIECRITSEDPANGFLPSTGRITHLHLPSGPGVRWDGGIEDGSEIGLHYDPMLAKLIVHAPSRALAIARMQRALRELVVEGVETSRSFHLRLLEHPDVQAGDISIQWLEAHLAELTSAQPDDDTIRRAAVVAALAAQHDRGQLAAPLNGAGADSGVREGWRWQARRESLGQ